jgi:hypothetical protein
MRAWLQRWGFPRALTNFHLEAEPSSRAHINPASSWASGYRSPMAVAEPSFGIRVAALPILWFMRGRRRSFSRLILRVAL